MNVSLLLFWFALLVQPILTEDAVGELENKEKIIRHVLNEAKRGQDPFTLVSEEDLELYWSKEDQNSLLQKIEKIKHNFEDFFSVEVKLVGFQDKNLEKKISKLLENFIDDLPLTAIQPDGNNHDLFIRKNFFFRVSFAENRLEKELTDTINSKLQSGETSIPYSLVNNIIQSFSSHGSSYVIYILNPNLNTKFTHVYVNTDGGTYSCGSRLWAGESERYAWVDITTRAIEYGPASSGEGLVTQFNLLSSQSDSKSLAVDIANFVIMSCEWLITPSFFFFPIFFHPKTIIHLVRMYDKGKPFLLDWNLLQLKLMEMPLFYNQEFEFKLTEIPFEECIHCSSAKILSTKIWTHSFSEEIFKVNRAYIDSRELRYWLQYYNNSFNFLHSQNQHTIPVFLLDLNTQKTMYLDSYQQAISFRDMVVAIQTENIEAEIPFKCDEKIVKISPKDATRAVLGSLLQTIWGISPTYEKWSSVHGRIVRNYVWAIGNTPFGPFSKEIELSFALKDAASRHLLYTKMHSFLSEVNSLFVHFQDYDTEVDEVLSGSDHLQFIRRWNFFQFKVEQAKKFLSLHDYNNSHAFVDSIKFDVTSLHKLIHHSGQNLHKVIHCPTHEEKPSRNSWLLNAFLLMSSLFSTGFFTYVILSKYMPKKGKRKIK